MRRKQMPWTATEALVMERIAERAEFTFMTVDRDTVVRDLQATILGGCRLRLDDLLAADDFNFAHDVLGINQHLDRQTFKFKDCFSPRYSLPPVEA